MQIGYLSETATTYVSGLKESQDFESLKNHVTKFRLVANDAYMSVMSTDFDWEEFMYGRKMENSGEYSGDEWNLKYGMILMPEILIRVGIYAMEYQAPFGVTYIRLREFGRIVETNGYAVWVEPEETT